MIVLLVFCAVYITIGYMVSKKVKTATDFFVAGRSMPLIIVAFTIAATHFGGGCFVGGIEWGVEKGVWPGMYAGIGLGIACFISAFVAGKFRSITNGITPPDYIEYRYGYSKFLRAYHAIVYITGTIAIIAIQFMAFAALATVVGISYNVAVILGAVVVIVYTYMAGMWGVMLNDFIQLVVCMIFIPIIVFLGLKITGMESGVTASALLSQPFFPQPESVHDFLYAVVPSVVGSIFAYEYFMKWQSTKSSGDAVKSCIVAGCILIGLSILVGLMSGIGASLFPGVPGKEVVAKIINVTLPKWAGYIFLAAVLSAIMSTSDSLMTSLGGMFAHDLYHKVFHPEKEFDDLKYTLTISKVATVLGAVFGVVIALKISGIIGVMFWISPLQAGCIFTPIIGGIIWKGGNKQGAIGAVIIGAIMALVDMTGLYAWPERMLFPMAGSMIAFFAVSTYFNNKNKVEESAVSKVNE